MVAANQSNVQVFLQSSSIEAEIRERPGEKQNISGNPKKSG
jgi:hypothetical protein